MRVHVCVCVCVCVLRRCAACTDDEYKLSATVDQQPYLLHIFDTSGQDEYHAVRQGVVHALTSLHPSFPQNVKLCVLLECVIPLLLIHVCGCVRCCDAFAL